MLFYIARRGTLLGSSASSLFVFLLKCTSRKGGPLDFGHLSFRATFANLSQSLRIKSPIWHPKTDQKWQMVALVFVPAQQPSGTHLRPSRNLPETYRNQSIHIMDITFPWILRTYAQPSEPYKSCSFIRVLQKYIHLCMSSFATFAEHFCFRDLSRTSIFLSRRHSRSTLW